MVSGDTDHCFEAFAIRCDPDPGPTHFVLAGDPEEVREAAIQRMGQAYHQMIGPDPDSVRYPSLAVVGKRIRDAREKLLMKWRSAAPLKKPLPEVVSHWKELRGKLRLWLPRVLSDFQDDPLSNKRYNEYLMFVEGSSFSRIVRRFAISSLPQVSQPVATYTPFPL
jgi:hypothetical protein